MKSCTSAGKDKLLDIKGLKVELDKYCSCMTDHILPNVYFKDLKEAMGKNQLIQLIFNENNIDRALKCFEENSTIEHNYKYRSSSKLSKEIVVNARHLRVATPSLQIIEVN